MLDEPAGRRNVDEPNHDDAENKRPPAAVFLNGGVGQHNVGSKTATTTRQAMKKKGGKKLRQTTTCCPPRLQHLLHHHHHHHNHHQQHHSVLQTTRSARNHHLLHPPHSNHNNNNNNVVSGGTIAALCSTSTRATTTVQSLQTEQPAASQPAAAPHHLKLGNNSKKELLKSKAVRCERVVTPPGVKHDHHTSQNRNSRSHRSKHSTTGPSSAHSVKRKDAGNPQKLPYSTPKTPLRSTDNVKIEEEVLSPTGHVNQEEGEKIYAGAKFSEPPSPSVLPKPPSHWVGENASQNGDQSREQMTVHLKSLLKVEGKA